MGRGAGTTEDGGKQMPVIDPQDVARVTSLDQLAGLLEEQGDLYVRFSAGPEADRDGSSVDGESGCVLPGLSVNPLRPEPWWDRPVQHWLARQLCQYLHLYGGERYAWVLTGELRGRGPDCEPLVDPARPVAVLEERVLQEASDLYDAVFDRGRRP